MRLPSPPPVLNVCAYFKGKTQVMQWHNVTFNLKRLYYLLNVIAISCICGISLCSYLDGLIYLCPYSEMLWISLLDD